MISRYPVGDAKDADYRLASWWLQAIEFERENGAQAFESVDELRQGASHAHRCLGLLYLLDGQANPGMEHLAQSFAEWPEVETILSLAEVAVQMGTPELASLSANEALDLLQDSGFEPADYLAETYADELDVVEFLAENRIGGGFDDSVDLLRIVEVGCRFPTDSYALYLARGIEAGFFATEDAVQILDDHYDSSRLDDLAPTRLVLPSIAGGVPSDTEITNSGADVSIWAFMIARSSEVNSETTRKTVSELFRSYGPRHVLRSVREIRDRLSEEEEKGSDAVMVGDSRAGEPALGATPQPNPITFVR